MSGSLHTLTASGWIALFWMLAVLLVICCVLPALAWWRDAVTTLYRRHHVDGLSGRATPRGRSSARVAADGGARAVELHGSAASDGPPDARLEFAQQSSAVAIAFDDGSPPPPPPPHTHGSSTIALDVGQGVTPPPPPPLATSTSRSTLSSSSSSSSRLPPPLVTSMSRNTLGACTGVLARRSHASYTALGGVATHGAAAAACSSAWPVQWLEYHDEDGTPFYVNEDEGISTWERPDGVKIANGEQPTEARAQRCA
jgi:hypothetical protein